MQFFVRFEVHAATNMKKSVFWDVAPCNLVDIDQRFIGAYCPDGGGSKLV
jgi:hypothetical protein